MKLAKPKPGPHVCMALLCEKVLKEQDGVLSLIRVIDRITFTLSGPDVPAQMPATKVDVTLVISLKAGDARGRHTLTVSPETPSTERLPPFQIPVHFEGEDRSAVAVVNVGLPVTQEGVYWLDVILDEDQVLTRVPLRVLYQPIRKGST